MTKWELFHFWVNHFLTLAAKLETPVSHRLSLKPKIGDKVESERNFGIHLLQLLVKDQAAFITLTHGSTSVERE